MKRRITALTHVQHDREADSKPLSLSLIRRLFTYTRPHARTRNLLLVAVAVRAIQLPALAWVIGAVIGGPVSKLDRRGILLGALGYAVLSVVTQLTFRYRSRLALELGEYTVRDLRKELFRHIQSMPMSFFHRARLGRLISRFTSDSEAVRNGIQNVLFISLVNLGQMIGAAVFMMFYDAYLFAVLAALSPLLWVINRTFSRRLSKAYRALQESFSRITSTLAESVGGIRVTQGFVREEVNSGLFQELVQDHSRFNMDAARAAGVFLPLLEFKTQLFIAVVLLLGGVRVLNGETDISALYEFIVMAGVFYGPIQTLGNQYNAALSAMAGAERVFKLLDTKPDWTDADDAADLPPIRGKVEFRDVTFGYNPARPVLHNISFVAEPGQTVALVGHTGSGKTSIINLLAKFYLPGAGRVLVDGCDIVKARSDSLHRQMGIVLQENFLFTGTIMDNIRMSRPDASREDVIRAAKDLDCLDLIASLPDGFNTVVGEKGSGISLGQRQLICFTRAMLANPRILILDEATSSVDTLTEARIQAALERLLCNRTSFVVAHRLSTVRHADLVLVLENGRIAERGTHDELLRRGEIYTELYREFVRSGTE